MNTQEIKLEHLTQQNIDYVCAIHREDISEAFVDNADTIMKLTQYGIDHCCIGHTYAIKYGDAYIGVILLGEAIEWDTDPEEMKGVPFYRLMGFVIDNRYRDRGIGGYVLETVIDTIYQEFGVRPIALGVHKDNHAAARFYAKHGFKKTDIMEGNDYYYLRYPADKEREAAQMDTREFRKPEQKDSVQIMDFKEEFQAQNSGMDGTGILFRSTAEEWLEYNRKMENPDDPNGLHCLQYGLFQKENGCLLGLLQIRLELMGYLTDFGGNIGYCVRPSERRKGYAKEMLRFALDICREKGLKKVLVTCLEDNVGSAKTIEACGGVFEKVVYDDKNYMANMKRYWCTL